LQGRKRELLARRRKAKVGEWRLGKRYTSKKVDVIRLKRLSNEGCVSEL
jgi:hypothetical protein